MQQLRIELSSWKKTVRAAMAVVRIYYTAVCAAPKTLFPESTVYEPGAGSASAEDEGNQRAVSGVVIRSTTPDDLVAITRIYGHYVAHGSATFEVECPGRQEMARRRAEILDLGLPYLTAVDGGAIAGYAYAGAYRSRRAYQFTVEDSVYVDAARAGKGIGSSLLAELIARCEMGPWKQMIAVIGDSGNAASIALHRKFGFREVGTLVAVGYKFERWVDTVLMQRGLGRAGMG